MKIVMDDLMNVKVVYTRIPITGKSAATTSGGGQVMTQGSPEGGEEPTAGEETTGEELTTGEATTGAEDSTEGGEETSEGGEETSEGGEETSEGGEETSEGGEETSEGEGNGEDADITAGEGGLDVDMNAGGGMAVGGDMMMGGDMMGGDMGTGTGDMGVKDPLLSSWPFVIGISAVTLAVSVVLGILLAKRKIKKGFDLYED